MTTVARELAEKLIDSVISEYGDEVFIGNGSIGRGLFFKKIVGSILDAEQRGRDDVLNRINPVDILDKRIKLSKKYGERSEGATFDLYVWLLEKLKEPT